MFRKGGEAMGGIMDGIDTRENFAFGNEEPTRGERFVEEVLAEYKPAVDPINQLLIEGGLRTLGTTGQGGTLANIAKAFEEPTRNLFDRLQRQKDFESKIKIKGKEIDLEDEMAKEKFKREQEGSLERINLTESLRNMNRDDLRKIRAQATLVVGEKRPEETEGDYNSRVQSKMAEFITAQYTKSPFLKTDSPEEKIYDEATRLVNTGQYKNRMAATNRAKFEGEDFYILKNKGVNIKDERAKKLKNNQGKVRKGNAPGFYYDDITDTYTEVGADGNITRENISFQELIGG